jgi:hypothetical protein
MWPPTVGIEVGHDLKGHDLCVELLGVFQVIIPNLVNNNCKETWQRHVWLLCSWISLKVGFVGGLGANTDDGCGIVGNVPVIEGEVRRPDKHGAAMVGFVLGSLRKDGHEEMDS